MGYHLFILYVHSAESESANPSVAQYQTDSSVRFEYESLSRCFVVPDFGLGFVGYFPGSKSIRFMRTWTGMCAATFVRFR